MVSFAGKLVGYKIIYMLLFLLCLCLYQVGTWIQTTDSQGSTFVSTESVAQIMVPMSYEVSVIIYIQFDSCIIVP